MNDAVDRGDNWHLDKRVPIAIIFALLMQAGGFGWFAATLDGRVGQNTRDIVRLDARGQTMQDAATSQAIQLGKIEEQIIGLRSDMSRLIGALERKAYP